MEDNKLIAEFMGWEYDENNDWYFTPHRVEVTDGIYDNEVPSDLFEFHTSWNWLMPVVEKIQSLGYEVQIRNTDCIIFQLLDTLKYKPIVDISSGNGKDSTYDAVVEFIKGQEVMDIHAQYSFYIECCVDEVEGEIALSFEEWKQLNN